MPTPPSEHDPLAGLTGLSEQSRKRIAEVLPFCVTQGRVDGRLDRDGQCRVRLRVRVPSNDGRQRYVSITLGSDARMQQQVLQILERYRAAHKRSPKDQTARLRKSLKLRTEMTTRRLLRKLVPSRSVFRLAWKQIKGHGLPDDTAQATCYIKLVAMQLQPLTRGRPRKGFFRQPAAPVKVRPFAEVDPRELLIAAMTNWSPRKPNHWNPQPPLRTEDLLPSGLPGLAKLA